MNRKEREIRRSIDARTSKWNYVCKTQSSFKKEKSNEDVKLMI